MIAVAIKVLGGQLSNAASAMIDKIGVASLLAIVGIDVAESKGTIELAATMLEPWGAFDWIKILAAIGTITFIIKNVIEARKSYIQLKILHKQEKLEEQSSKE